jgi:hypothetical protein
MGRVIESFHATNGVRDRTGGRKKMIRTGIVRRIVVDLILSV